MTPTISCPNPITAPPLRQRSGTHRTEDYRRRHPLYAHRELPHGHLAQVHPKAARNYHNPLRFYCPEFNLKSQGLPRPRRSPRWSRVQHRTPQRGRSPMPSPNSRVARTSNVQHRTPQRGRSPVSRILFSWSNYQPWQSFIFATITRGFNERAALPLFCLAL